jgi:hypothetical protein
MEILDKVERYGFERQSAIQAIIMEKYNQA